MGEVEYEGEKEDNRIRVLRRFSWSMDSKALIVIYLKWEYKEPSVITERYENRMGTDVGGFRCLESSEWEKTWILSKEFLVCLFFPCSPIGYSLSIEFLVQ